MPNSMLIFTPILNDSGLQNGTQKAPKMDTKRLPKWIRANWRREHSPKVPKTGLHLAPRWILAPKLIKNHPKIDQTSINNKSNKIYMI